MDAMASCNASTRARSRPSEKLGTHSIRVLAMRGLVRIGSLRTHAIECDAAVADRYGNVGNAKAPRNFAIVGNVQHDDIGTLSYFQTTDDVPAANSVRGVNGRGGNGLFHGEAETQNRERDHHLHAERGCPPRMIAARKSDS